MDEAAPDDLAEARADLDRLVRRLRRLSPRAWAADGREDHIRALVVALAAIGAPGRTLPQIERHALPDVVAVVGNDALDMGGAVPAVRALVLDARDAMR